MDNRSLHNLPEESAEDLYENAPCGYISFLPDGTIFKINKTLLNLLGYKKEEVIQKKKLLDLFKIGGKIYFETHFFPLVKMQGFAREINFDLVRKDGTFFPGLLNVDQVTDPGTDISIYRASILDITDRKKYEKVLIEAKEKAEKATRAKAEFLSTISHEIRTPLNAIVGIGNLFQQTSMDELQREYARILQASSGNLLELVNNLLDLSKLEAQKIKLEKRAFDLKELLEVLVHAFRIKAEEKNVRLETEFPDNLPDHLQGDPVKLNQVLTNLLGNAIKFTNSGVINVKVSIRDREEEKIYLRFIVSDTGIGIPKDKLEIIFQEFSQASYDVNLEYGGTGLGLTISQKLLQMHGSELKVESEEGKGSTFSFDLRYKISKETSKKNKRRKVTEILRKSAAKILVVDDNPTNLFITSQYLQGWNLEYTTVNSGPAAIEAVQRQAYDLILMDLHMPRMNGYEASTKINELNLDSNPAIIALSASGRGDVNLKMERAGIDAYVSKPFDPLELQEVMVRVLTGNAEEKLQEVDFDDNSFNDTSKKISGEEHISSVNLSRYSELANGDFSVLKKLINNAIQSLKKFRNDFDAVVSEGSPEKINELTHKNTMTLHYVGAQRLIGLMEDYQELIRESETDPQILKDRRGLVMEEFDKIISELESVNLKENL